MVVAGLDRLIGGDDSLVVLDQGFLEVFDEGMRETFVGGAFFLAGSFCHLNNISI